MVESCSDAKWSGFGMPFEYQTAQSFEKWLSFLSFSYPFSCAKSPSFLWNSSPKWLTLLSWEQQIFIYHYGARTLDSRTLDSWPKKTLDSWTMDSWDIGFPSQFYHSRNQLNDSLAGESNVQESYVVAETPMPSNPMSSNPMSRNPKSWNPMS